MLLWMRWPCNSNEHYSTVDVSKFIAVFSIFVQLSLQTRPSAHPCTRPSTLPTARPFASIKTTPLGKLPIISLSWCCAQWEYRGIGNNSGLYLWCFRNIGHFTWTNNIAQISVQWKHRGIGNKTTFIYHITAILDMLLLQFCVNICSVGVRRHW